MSAKWGCGVWGGLCAVPIAEIGKVCSNSFKDLLRASEIEPNV